MKSVTFVSFLFLSSFKISSSFKVKSPSPTEKEVHSASPNFEELSQDDPALQRALHKVLREMNTKLNKTTGKANERDDTVTKKLKLFFVTPSGISEDYVDIEGLDYSDARYNVESNQMSTFVTDKQLGSSFKDNVNINIASKSMDASEGLRLDAPPSKSVSGTYFGGVKSSKSYGRDGLEWNHIVDEKGNGTSEVFQNESQTMKNDKVEMKVELTINLSENDHVHGLDSEVNTEKIKNLSHDSGRTHLSGKTDDPESLGVHIPHQVSEETNPILNLATSNLNLNIKLMSHNHTDFDIKQENDNASKLVNIQKRQESDLDDHSSSNLNSSRRSEISHNVNIGSSHNIHQAKNSTDQLAKTGSQNSGLSNLSNLSSREAKSINAPSANKGEGKSDWIKAEYSPTTESSNSEDPGKTENRTIPVSTFSLSDSLKKEIENISNYFIGEVDNSSEGVANIRNLIQFLPQKGGNVEERKKIEQLRKYFSQPDFLDKFGIRNKDSQTDFEVFIEVLRKLEQSSIVRESSFYPIILYYLKLLPETKSEEDDDSSDESWYSESFVNSLVDYLFDYSDQDLITSSVKVKLHYLGNEFNEDSDLNSQEYDYTF